MLFFRFEVLVSDYIMLRQVQAANPHISDVETADDESLLPLFLCGNVVVVDKHIQSLKNMVQKLM